MTAAKQERTDDIKLFDREDELSGGQKIKPRQQDAERKRPIRTIKTRSGLGRELL